MEKRELLYEGKAKQVYATVDPDLVIQYFKDDATAFNAQKRGTIVNKGRYNNAISASLFRYLEEHGVPTHFVRTLSEREMLVRRLEIIPVEVVVRNVIAGSLAKRLGLSEGRELPRPILEHYYKNDALGDPLINPWHITVLGFASEGELEEINRRALQVNDSLRTFLQPRGLILVDFKLEFGRFQGRLLLADEISPDTCRFWDAASGEKLDKDRFRFDLGNVESAYAEVHRRICGVA